MVKIWLAYEALAKPTRYDNAQFTGVVHQMRILITIFLVEPVEIFVVEVVKNTCLIFLASTSVLSCFSSRQDIKRNNK